jgi:sigma-E factor negative regulatory protein RseC
MITEQGTIDKISGKNATVRIRKSSACSSCESRDSCDVHGAKPMEIEVDNRLQAAEGDQVEVSVPSGTLVILSLYVYLIPVAALIAGAYVGGTLLAPHLALGETPCSIVLGFLAMGVTFILLRRFDKTPGANKKYRPRMTRIVTRFQR